MFFCLFNFAFTLISSLIVLVLPASSLCKDSIPVYLLYNSFRCCLLVYVSSHHSRSGCSTIPGPGLVLVSPVNISSVLFVKFDQELVPKKESPRHLPTAFAPSPSTWASSHFWFILPVS